MEKYVKTYLDGGGNIRFTSEAFKIDKVWPGGNYWFPFPSQAEHTMKCFPQTGKHTLQNNSKAVRLTNRQFSSIWFDLFLYIQLRVVAI